MKPVPIHAAKAQPSNLIERACDGEDVVIAWGRQPVVRLVLVDRGVPSREFGALRGRWHVGPSFFDPLPEDELAAWEK